MLIRVLLSISSPELRSRLRGHLEKAGAAVSQADLRRSELPVEILRRPCDLLVVERELLGRRPEPFLKALRQSGDRPGVLVIKEEEEPKERARLLAAGCLAVLCRSLPDRVLATTLAALLQRRREAVLHRRAADILSNDPLVGVVSQSPSMASLLEKARRVEASDCSLLILGETGVGKEWLARAIHSRSPRSQSPFTAVNCAALPESLLESELFGHEKGAFTGAEQPRRGLFELAHQGTLLLDEIADLAPPLQAKLLRVLEGKRFRRLGSEKEVQVDVRIMASTNLDLREAVEQKRFRADLFYRLGVVTLEIPPLRERREDIPRLALSYLQHFCTKLGGQVRGFRPEAIDALANYRWPGNVRELINTVERAVLLCRRPEISLEDLWEHPSRPARDPYPALPADRQQKSYSTLRREALEALDRSYFCELLRQTQGKVGEAARRAGLDPRSLHAKMKRLGLRKEAFRSRDRSSAPSSIEGHGSAGWKTG